MPGGLLGGAATTQLLGDAGHLAREHPGRALGRRIARPDPGPAARDDQPRPVREGRAQRPLDAVRAVRHDDRLIALEAGVAQRGDGDRPARIRSRSPPTIGRTP